MNADAEALFRPGDRGSSPITEFVRIGASGSHQKWRHPLTGKQVIVAHHSGRVLPLGAMRAIIEGSGIEPSEWLK
ncbi:MAG: type II toxin-antitoxin system HicA family toxin [Bryobacteraceae bacterium]